MRIYGGLQNDEKQKSKPLFALKEPSLSICEKIFSHFNSTIMVIFELYDEYNCIQQKKKLRLDIMLTQARRINKELVQWRFRSRSNWLNVDSGLFSSATKSKLRNLNLNQIMGNSINWMEWNLSNIHSVCVSTCVTQHPIVTVTGFKPQTAKLRTTKCGKERKKVENDHFVVVVVEQLRSHRQSAFVRKVESIMMQENQRKQI